MRSRSATTTSAPGEYDATAWEPNDPRGQAELGVIANVRAVPPAETLDVALGDSFLIVRKQWRREA